MDNKPKEKLFTQGEFDYYDDEQALPSAHDDKEEQLDDSSLKTHDVNPFGGNREKAYPWPNLPVNVRPALEHCFNLDAYKYHSDDSAEMARWYMMTDINKQQAYVETYCGDELNQATLEAAALGIVKDIQAGLNSTNQGKIRANNILTDYVLQRENINKNDLHGHNPSSLAEQIHPSRETIYAIGLLQDRERLFDLKQKCVNPNNENDVIPIDRQPKPRDVEWLENPTIADPDLLSQTVENVNVESILIAGAEAMQRLDDHAEDSRATLNDIKFIERVLGPIAEVIGFDTMAQAMYDKTKRLRLKYGGKQYLVDYADSILERVNKFNEVDGVDDNVKHIVGGATRELFKLDEPVLTNQPIAYNKQNQAVYGYSDKFDLHINGEDIPVSLRYRLKTGGSLAWKMFKEEQAGKDIGNIPMDIVGTTVVLESEGEKSVADQRKVFAALVRGATTTDDPDVSLRPAPSKNSPVHVAGTEDYVKHMSQSLTDIYNQPIDKKVASNSDGLHLGKITLMYHNIPCEV